MKKYIGFIFFVFFSCSESPSVDIKRIENMLGTKIEWNYKIKNYQYDVGIGSSTLVYDLKFSDKDFQILLRNLPTNKFDKFNNFYYKNEIKNGFNIRILLIIDKSIIRYSENEL